jgi:Uma2 family endonuclease
MDELLRREALPAGYKVQSSDGHITMTPWSPEQDWTVDEVRVAARKAAIPRERVFSNVLVRFPGENDAAPDLTIIAEGAWRHRGRYSCVDLLAVVEVASRPEDKEHYVRNVAKYGRYGIETYLIADPFKQVCTLMTEPQPTGYAKRRETPYGETVTFPLVTGERFSVDTSDFPVHPTE